MMTMNTTDTEMEPTESLESPAPARKARQTKNSKRPSKKASKRSTKRASKNSGKRVTSTKRTSSKSTTTRSGRGTAAERKANGTHLLVIRCEVALVNKMRKMLAANAKAEKGPTTLNALAVELLTKRLA